MEEQAANSQDSVTASEYINSQLELEKEARELLPYSFETCTYSMGPLRQPVYACKAHSAEGAICYSCSISCHGDCELVELFTKRNIQCDCGTTRIPELRCTLRSTTGDAPALTNRYCHNYEGRFCVCDKDYEYSKEKGTMYQCMLGDACNEDWYHDSCIVGADAEKIISPQVVEITQESDATANGATDSEKAPAGPESVTGVNPAEETEDNDDDDDEDPPPPGFPREEFDSFICWLCIEKNPWLKRYAGTPGFLPPVIHGTENFSMRVDGDGAMEAENPEVQEDSTKMVPVEEAGIPGVERGCKRKAFDLDSSMEDTGNILAVPPASKRIKTPDLKEREDGNQLPEISCKYSLLPTPTAIDSKFSLFLKEDFRSHLCRCDSCFPNRCLHPVLLEEEETYEPPLDSDSNNGETSSQTSLLDMGERALNAVDRVRAIEGVMVYNQLKEKVKDFLKPFAKNGVQVSAEDVRKYFEELRGDGNSAVGSSAAGTGTKGPEQGEERDGRREEQGY